MTKTLAIGLSPNTQKDDVLLALRLFFSPWKNMRSDAVHALEKWFGDYFKASYAVSFLSGRGALYAIMHEMNIKRGDEVIMQAFTCTVVSDAILATGARPVYADITSELTVNPKDLEKKITKRTKAIIIQHTFGIAADMEKLLAIAKKHHIFLIEDVAHTIGATYKKNKLGTFGDAAIFSFGRDKAFSSVWGGMAITNNSIIGQKLQNYQKLKITPSLGFVYQQLLHPLIASFAITTYDMLSLGKVIMFVAQRVGLISRPVLYKEKQGKFSMDATQKLPNVLAFLALQQLKKIEQYNLKRQDITKVYQKEIPKQLQCTSQLQPLLRFPILVDDPAKLLQMLRQKLHVYGGTWYSNVIDPKGSNLQAICYVKGSCPNAEKIALHSVNLPVLPSMVQNDAKKIAKVVLKNM